MAICLVFQPNARLAWFNEDRVTFVDSNLALSDIRPGPAVRAALASGIGLWTACISQVRRVHGESAARQYIESMSQCPPGFTLSVDTLVRFWSKVEMRSEGCWCWLAARHGKDSPYGRFWIGVHLWYAHQIAYQVVHGPLLENQYLVPTCENRACLHPLHLTAATYQVIARQNPALIARDEAICEAYIQNPRLTQADVAERFGVSVRTVRAALTQAGENWSHRRGCRGGSNPQTSLVDADILAMRAAFRSGVCQAELARRYEMDPSSVHRIVHGKRWNHLPV